jgi:hypothetical protein
VFADQKHLALSFYDTALFDYIDACEQTCWMYDPDGRKPDNSECIRASTRFIHAYSRLKTVVKVSNYKFGTNLVMPQLILDTSWFEKMQ